jgi:hypothetical protein
MVRDSPEAYRVLNSEVILRVTTRSVQPRQGRASLVTVKKTSAEYTVIINNLPLLTFCEFSVKPACAGVSHCLRVSPHAVL